MTNIKLKDIALEENKTTSFFIEDQFPAIYKENGKELIELVTSYYKFLEQHEMQSTYNIRRIYEYRDIDTTLESMLVFFKNKFLNGLFFEEDARFIVKNILDLYRRKGSKEGIELFFKMFFETEADVYFPSQDIFKPSSSLYKTGSFIQLYSTNKLNIFNGIVNRKIFGDISNAEAFVDNVYFVNVRGAYVPILFLSNVKGEFTGFDTVYSLDPNQTYGVVYGSLRKVRIDQIGSGSGGNSVGDLVDFVSDTGTGAKGRVSKVTQELSGEIEFEIQDGNYGYTDVNTTIIISDQTAFFGNTEGTEFEINETIKQSKTINGSGILNDDDAVTIDSDIITTDTIDVTVDSEATNTVDVFGTVIGNTSDSIGIFLDYSKLDIQQLFVNTSGNEYNQTEKISQINSFGIQVFGSIIDEEPGKITVELDKTNPDVKSQRFFFEAGSPVVTVDRVNNITKMVTSVEDDYFFKVDSSGQLFVETVSRENNITKLPLFITAPNKTAKAEIGTLKNTETITIITDLLENYLNVRLDSVNYSSVPPAELEMSGTRVNGIIPNLNTTLNEAFVPETFTIGEIATLKNINPGFDHVSDVFVLARENILRRFNLKNQILNVSVPTGAILFENDILTQQKEIVTFEGITKQVQVKGQIVAVEGNNITVKQLTFESFVTQTPIFKEGSLIPITVNFRSRDQKSLPLGLNAKIDGNVEIVTGKIIEVDVFDSGIGYENDSEVKIINTTKEPSGNIDSFGTSISRQQGITAGRWRSFVSHINQEKVIQDSFFYQDFSYQLTTDIEPEFYESEYKEIMHPVGIKLFTNFGKIDSINIDVNILEADISKFRVEDNIELITEQETLSVLSENGFPYLLSSIVEED